MKSTRLILALILCVAMSCSSDTKGQSFAGDLDQGFSYGNGGGTVNTVAVQPDGKVLVGGPFNLWSGESRKRIARLHGNGVLDASFAPVLGFGPDPSSVSQVNDILVQPDGKILVLGDFNTYEGVTVNHIVRLNDDGTIDASFNQGTGFPDGGKYNRLAIQSDGKILVGGTFTEYNAEFSVLENLFRLLPDGSFDTSFQGAPDVIFPGSEVFDIEVSADDYIMLSVRVGCCQRWIQQLNSDGSLNAGYPGATFDNDAPFDIAFQLDGKLVAVGSFTQVNGSDEAIGVARFLQDGSFDTIFETGSGPDAAAKSVLVQPDGKIIIGGTFDTWSGNDYNRIVRLRENGEIDLTFVPNTGFDSSGDAKDLAFNEEYGIYCAGSFLTYQSQTVARFCLLKNFLIMVTSVFPEGDLCIGQEITVNYTIYPSTGFDAGNNFYFWAGTDIVSAENYFTAITSQVSVPQTFPVPIDTTPGDMYFFVSSDAPTVQIDFGNVFGPIAILQPLVPTVQIEYEDTGICEGSTIEFSAEFTSGGDNPQFEWFVNGVQQPENTEMFTTNDLVDGDELWVNLVSNQFCVTPEVIPSGTEDIELTPSSTSVQITVLGSGGPVEDMMVDWYSTEQSIDNLSFPLSASSPTDAIGMVTFSNVPPGTYRVRAFPNSANAEQADMINTWFPQGYGWVWGDDFTVGCASGVAETIQMIENPLVGNNVNVAGIVTYGSGRSSFTGDPIPGLPIIVTRDSIDSESQPIDDAVLLTLTNSEGIYNFDELPGGSYKMYIDAPGLPLEETHFFQVTEGQTIFANRNFCIDTINGIYTGCLEDFVTEINRGELIIYPNPSSGSVIIQLPEGVDARQFSRVLMNSEGRVIRPHSERASASLVQWDMTGLPAGLYHAAIWNDRDRLTGRLMLE